MLGLQGSSTCPLFLAEICPPLPLPPNSYVGVLTSDYIASRVPQQDWAPDAQGPQPAQYPGFSSLYHFPNPPLVFPGLASQTNQKSWPNFNGIKFKTGDGVKDSALKARPMINSKSRPPEDTTLPGRMEGSSANLVAAASCAEN